MALPGYRENSNQNWSLVLDLIPEATTINERSVPRHGLNIKLPELDPVASPTAGQMAVPSQAYIMEKLQGQNKQDWTDRLFYPSQFD